LVKAPEEPSDEKIKARLREWKDAIEGTSEKMKIPDLPDKMVKELGAPDYKQPAKTRGYAYFDVRGVQIYASSQEHAEKIAEIALKNGDLEEY
jgi:hypothetical protein